MSWQAYIDTSLVGSGQIDKGAIISAAGDSVWAASPGFTVSAAEMKAISNIVSGSEAAKNDVYANGFHVAGERFVAFRVEDRSLYGRKGQEGICVAKTKQAIVIGHYNKDQQAGNSAKTVEALADYLIGQGY